MKDFSKRKVLKSLLVVVGYFLSFVACCLIFKFYFGNLNWLRSSIKLTLTLLFANVLANLFVNIVKISIKEVVIWFLLLLVLGIVYFVIPNIILKGNYYLYFKSAFETYYSLSIFFFVFSLINKLKYKIRDDKGNKK